MDEGFVVAVTFKENKSNYLTRTQFYSRDDSYSQFWCEPFYAHVYKTEKGAQRAADNLANNCYESVKVIKTDSEEFKNYLTDWESQFNKILKDPTLANPYCDGKRIYWWPKVHYMHEWFVFGEYDGSLEAIRIDASNKYLLPFTLVRNFYNLKKFCGWKLTKFKFKKIMYDNGQIDRDKIELNSKDNHDKVLESLDEIKKRPVLNTYKGNIKSYKEDCRTNLDNCLKQVSYPLMKN